MTPDPGLLLVVSLWLQGDDVAAFEAFERDAAAAMRRHGGRIERVVRVDRGAASADAPFEIHLVRFPDRAAFDAYRASPEAQALAPRRAQVVARTEIVLGKDLTSVAP